MEVSRRAGRPVWIPDDVAGHCCATPWSSKGYREGSELMARNRSPSALWRWSDGGRAAGGDRRQLVRARAWRRTSARTSTRRIASASRSSRCSTRSPGPTTTCCPTSRSRGASASVAVHPTCSAGHLGVAGQARGARWARSPTRSWSPSAATLLRHGRRPRAAAPRAARRRRCATRPPSSGGATFDAHVCSQPHLRDRPPAGDRPALRVVRVPARAADPPGLAAPRGAPPPAIRVQSGVGERVLEQAGGLRMVYDETLRGHGGEVHVRVWEHDEPVRVAIVVHGYGEHIGRYDHVAARARRARRGGVGTRPRGPRALRRRPCADPRLRPRGGRPSRPRDPRPRRLPALPVVMVAHSMGGMVASLYAERFPGELSGLVLSAPLIGTNAGRRAAGAGRDPGRSRSTSRCCRATAAEQGLRRGPARVPRAVQAAHARRDGARAFWRSPWTPTA